MHNTVSNFVRKYGEQRLKDTQRKLNSGQTHSEIAELLGISRVRATQLVGIMFKRVYVLSDVAEDSLDVLCAVDGNRLEDFKKYLADEREHKTELSFIPGGQFGRDRSQDVKKHSPTTR